MNIALAATTAASKNIISDSDGTNTWIRLEANFIEPVLLDGNMEDKYELIINNDFTGLLHYKANIVFGEEIGIE